MFDDRNGCVFVSRLVLFVLVGVDVPCRFLRVGLDRFFLLISIWQNAEARDLFDRAPLRLFSILIRADMPLHISSGWKAKNIPFCRKFHKIFS